jgi:hypothetical protein
MREISRPSIPDELPEQYAEQCSGPSCSGLDSALDSALGPAVVVQRVLRILYPAQCPGTVFYAPKQYSRPANRAELQADRAQGACLLTFLARRAAGNSSY